MINGNMIGIGSAPLKTVILEDENGSQITGVVTESKVIFTATDNDVREGLVYASDEGVSTGTKEIPSYRTTEGYELIPPYSDFIITCLSKNDNFDYTSLQCIITVFDTNIENSNAAEKIVINSSVYNVGSGIKISDVAADFENKSINLNITNDSDNYYLIQFFTYKEEY